MLVKHISYPASEGTQLKFLKVARTDVSQICKKWPNPEFRCQLKEFIINIAIAPAKQGEHVISWVELSILFEIRLGAIIPDNLGQLQAENDIYKQHIPFQGISELHYRHQEHLGSDTWRMARKKKTDG